jgi:hypothetical protein
MLVSRKETIVAARKGDRIFPRSALFSLNNCREKKKKKTKEEENQMIPTYSPLSSVFLNSINEGF